MDSGMIWMSMGTAGLLAIALLVALAVIVRQAARVRDVEESLKRDELTLRRLSAEVYLMTQAQQATATKIDAMATMAEAREAAPQSGPTRGYEQAIRMARTGAPSAQLVSSCGVPRSEADLLVALHGPQVAA